MTKKPLLTSLVVALALGAVAQAASQAKLTVRADRPGVKISPMLYGIFFEEINRAGDGGIYAEMLQNRSFEDAAVPLGWSVVKGNGKMALDRSRPLNPNNPTALRLEGPVSVANDGFKGAPTTAARTRRNGCQGSAKVRGKCPAASRSSRARTTNSRCTPAARGRSP